MNKKQNNNQIMNYEKNIKINESTNIYDNKKLS